MILSRFTRSLKRLLRRKRFNTCPATPALPPSPRPSLDTISNPPIVINTEGSVLSASPSRRSTTSAIILNATCARAERLVLVEIPHTGTVEHSVRSSSTANPTEQQPDLSVLRVESSSPRNDDDFLAPHPNRLSPNDERNASSPVPTSLEVGSRDVNETAELASPSRRDIGVQTGDIMDELAWDTHKAETDAIDSLEWKAEVEDTPIDEISSHPERGIHLPQPDSLNAERSGGGIGNDPPPRSSRAEDSLSPFRYPPPISHCQSSPGAPTPLHHLSCTTNDFAYSDVSPRHGFASRGKPHLVPGF
ncbi:hypothetical protein JAAARDRAFT_63378 [Jaapia argillacea MUCL 33604]|uniref:Uncharacterized protein n=1 Tax=Jaapia argillacea MUCL 33604 TaxID=933084 RepID=A0A067PGE5_9AGAM|nr:hypothetical protein JAAARDRAFT_63378 [Jaapia argillacea MUCL 33604]